MSRFSDCFLILEKFGVGLGVGAGGGAGAGAGAGAGVGLGLGLGLGRGWGLVQLSMPCTRNARPKSNPGRSDGAVSSNSSLEKW